jgi:hypothetical protein
MPNEEMKEKIMALIAHRAAILDALVPLARAAANQMADAAMHRGADPLMQRLFELDAIDTDIQALGMSDPDAFLQVVLKIARGL